MVRWFASSQCLGLIEGQLQSARAGKVSFVGEFDRNPNVIAFDFEELEWSLEQADGQSLSTQCPTAEERSHFAKGGTIAFSYGDDRS